MYGAAKQARQTLIGVRRLKGRGNGRFDGEEAQERDDEEAELEKDQENEEENNQDSGPPGKPEPVTLQMLENEPFKRFWEFATAERRSRSTAQAEAKNIRGCWLGEDLVVERVHGWGTRSVRLLCVHATSEERRQRLRLFFRKDRHDAESRMRRVKDPLEQEPRVLVKVPIAVDGTADWSWAGAELEALAELGHLTGIPRLEGLIFFEDVRAHALVYPFSSARPLQEELESGTYGLRSEEDAQEVAVFLLRTLARAHDCGWLHTALRPEVVLLPPRDKSASEEGQTRRLICGWSHAVRCSPGSHAIRAGGLLQLLKVLPAQDSPCSTLVSGDVGRETVDAALDTSTGEEVTDDAGGRIRQISLWSTPEQMVSLFLDRRCESVATDVQRAAAVAASVLGGHAPMAFSSYTATHHQVGVFEELRRLCLEAVFKRTSCAERTTSTDEAAFAASLERLLAMPLNLPSKCGQEVREWFGRALAREPTARFLSAAEAIEALDSAALARDRRVAEAPPAEGSSSASCSATASARVRVPPTPIVLEPPAELAEMTVL